MKGEWRSARAECGGPSVTISGAQLMQVLYVASLDINLQVFICIDG